MTTTTAAEEATSRVRDNRFGPARSPEEDFARVKHFVVAYIENSGLFYTSRHKCRFIKAVADAYEAVVHNPHDKTMRDDPTGETAVKNIMKELAA